MISGINIGENCGLHPIYSGTVAGARQGALHGFPSMAVSVAIDRTGDARYDTAATAAIQTLDNMLLMKEFDWNQFFLNLNVPSVPFDQLKGFVLTRQSRTDYSGWVLKPSDIDIPHDEWVVNNTKGVQSRKAQNNTETPSMSICFLTLADSS